VGQVKRIYLKDFLRRVDRHRGNRFRNSAEIQLDITDKVVTALFDRFQMLPMSFSNFFQDVVVRLSYIVIGTSRIVTIAITYEAAKVYKIDYVMESISLSNPRVVEEIVDQFAAILDTFKVVH